VGQSLEAVTARIVEGVISFQLMPAG